MELIFWDIYDIASETTPITGVMLRGRIRKFCLDHSRNVLVENTQDVDGQVRFAIPEGESVKEIAEYVTEIIAGAAVTLVRSSVPNPVLSKLKVNIESRYTLK